MVLLLFVRSYFSILVLEDRLLLAELPVSYAYKCKAFLTFSWALMRPSLSSG